MAKLRFTIEQRTRLIGYLIASTAMLLLFSLIQTFSGQSRFDLTFDGALCLAATVICPLPFFGAIAAQFRL